ncbi:BamA/TamA family outer membrane protein [uncultured Microscilla sp.]|uniref:BamA/TamA family outer membrane protein n=1 Tax=uncultured Microscilla sp. TaxID=432653 RepID=UPI00260CDB3A|nr:BamA/TamA family outer membrane protein [uncultured Microscilla sp.]
MGIIRKTLHTITAILLTIQVGLAQDTLSTPADSSSRVGRVYTQALVPPYKPLKKKEKKKNGFLASPFIFYKPDTELIFGGLGIYYFRLGTKNNTNKETRLSYAQAIFEYTLNNQVDIQAGWNIFLPNESYISKGFFRFKVYPDLFYGVGNNTKQYNELSYVHNTLIFNTSLAKKLAPNVFLGLEYRYANTYNINFENSTSEVLDNVPGISGGLNSGLGLIFTIDKRDNVVNATKGFLLEFSKYNYNSKLGSTFNYSNVNFTFNKYFDLGNKQVLATNTVANLNSGDPSFLFMAFAGGEKILRSYAMNRFRDKNFVGTQIEYRRHLFWRLGMVGFAGIGDVFDQTSDFSWSKAKYSYGIGLRFMVNKQENMNFRIDYGRGRDSQAVYMTVTEAF